MMEKEMVEKINDAVYAAVCEAAEKIKARNGGEPILATQKIELEAPEFTISREQRRSHKNGSYKRRKCGH